MENRKFLTLPGSNSVPSVIQPVAGRYTDGAIPATVIKLSAYNLVLSEAFNGAVKQNKNN
jgi:hypothetical protein